MSPDGRRASISVTGTSFLDAVGADFGSVTARIVRSEPNSLFAIDYRSQLSTNQPLWQYL